MDTESVVRQAFEAFNSKQMEARMELFDPDIELTPMRAALEGLVYRGHAGIRQFEGDLTTSWAERHAEIRDLEVRGDEAVVIGALRLRGTASGATVEQNMAWAFKLRNGRVARFVPHQTADDARQALGWDT